MNISVDKFNCFIDSITERVNIPPNSKFSIKSVFWVYGDKTEKNELFKNLKSRQFRLYNISEINRNFTKINFNIQYEESISSYSKSQSE